MCMVQAKNVEAWSHTSAIMSLLLNVNKDTKKHGVTPFDAFNPYVDADLVKKPPSESEVKFAFSEMKRIFVDNAPEYKKAPQGEKIILGEKIIVEGVENGRG